MEKFISVIVIERLISGNDIFELVIYNFNSFLFIIF